MSPADIVKSINMSQAETKVGHLKIWPFIGCNTDIQVDFGAGTMVKGIASPDEGLQFDSPTFNLRIIAGNKTLVIYKYVTDINQSRPL